MRDEAAFETLLQRHGPMVLGVCRRMLDDPHAVDHGFQVTFLVAKNHILSAADQGLLNLPISAKHKVRSSWVGKNCQLFHLFSFPDKNCTGPGPFWQY
jgi:hypothetical protein